MSASDPVDWDGRYVSENTPWDQGGPLSLLTEAIADGLLGRPGTAFAPGAGRGHDAAGLAAAGWQTTVVDLSPTAAAYATEHYPAVHYVVGDALDPRVVLAATDGPVDLMWDHTFFCALPPAMRPQVGALAAAVVKPGGLLASGIFPIDRPDPEGPPYRYGHEDMSAVLESFELISLSEPVSIAQRFPWHHRLGVWRRVA